MARDCPTQVRNLTEAKIRAVQEITGHDVPMDEEEEEETPQGPAEDQLAELARQLDFDADLNPGSWDLDFAYEGDQQEDF